MSWFKVDDAFDMHPKVLSAGNAAAGLWLRGGSYCARNLTDGFVPHDVAKLYGTPQQIAALLRVGLWVRVSGGYEMHQYLERNPSRAEVLAERKKTAERVARWKERQKNAETNGVGNGVSNGPPDPTRPDPTRSSTSRDLDTGPTDINAGRSRLVDQALTLAITAELAARDITRPVENRDRWALGYRSNKLNERATELSEWLERNPAGGPRALAVEVFGANPLYLPFDEVAS